MDNLEPKYIKFIDAYFRCSDVKSVCKKCKITINTYYTYLNNTAVKKEINKQLNRVLKDTTRYLQSNLNNCCNELMNIVNNKDIQPQIKINAINSVFNITLKLTEQTDILDRLNELEDKINWYYKLTNYKIQIIRLCYKKHSLFLFNKVIASTEIVRQLQNST